MLLKKKVTTSREDANMFRDLIWPKWVTYGKVNGFFLLLTK